MLVQGLAEMRSGATTDNKYMQVLHIFGPAMLGVMAWADLEKSKAICDVMSVTDEAFIHLVIQNYQDRWNMMAERSQYHQPLVRAFLFHVFVHRHVNTHHTANLVYVNPRRSQGTQMKTEKSGCRWQQLCTQIRHPYTRLMLPARCRIMDGRTKVSASSIGSVKSSLKSALLSPTMMRSTRHGQRNFVNNAPPNVSAVRSCPSTTS